MLSTAAYSRLLIKQQITSSPDYTVSWYSYSSLPLCEIHKIIALHPRQLGLPPESRTHEIMIPAFIPTFAPP